MTSFAALGIPAAVDRSLHARRISTPFPIQVAAIPPALAGRDVCGKAPTGSGKTIAFGIPLVTRCSVAEPGAPTGLVLLPTRELAEQVAEELRLLADPIGLIVDSFYGGTSAQRQIDALAAGVDIAVGCPGRLRDLIDRGVLRLSEVQLAVVDEADRLADMGFLPEVLALLDETPEGRQTLLFSATLDAEVAQLTQRYQSDPAMVSTTQGVGEESILDIEHFWWSVPRKARLDTTAAILRRFSTAIVFCRTRHGADRVSEQLQQRGISTAVLHGDRTQKEREAAMTAFRDGEVQALVATDVASRGLHIAGVDAVVQFDTPADEKDYIHRAGRTARAGSSGKVINLIIPEAEAKATELQRLLHHPQILEPAQLGAL